MPAALVLLLVLVALLLVAAIVPWVLIARWKRRRREEVAVFARRREWEYRVADATLVDRFHGSPFDVGHTRTAENVLLGQYGDRPFVAFDLQVDTTTSIAGHGAGSLAWYSVAALNLGRQAPDLSVHPKGPLGRLIDRVTGRDLPTGNVEFDEAFKVRSASPEFARDLLVPGVVSVMLRNPAAAWRIDGDSMLMISPRVLRSPPEEIETRLALMVEVLAEVPSAVWQRLDRPTG